MSRLGPGKTLLTVYVDKDLVTQIDRMAAAQDTSRSKYVVNVLREAVGQDEIATHVLTNPILIRAFGGAMAQPGVMREITAAMKSEVDDEQLNLFQRTMVEALEAAERHAKAKGPVDRRSRPPAKVKPYKRANDRK